MGILAAKALDDALTDLAAVFIVGLGQQQNVLGHAAPGSHVTPAEAEADQLLEVFHAAVQAALGKVAALLVCDRQQADVNGGAAAGDGPGLGVIDDLEKIDGDNDTIGLLLCKDADKYVAETTLKKNHLSLGISKYMLIEELPEYLERKLKEIKG